ncbi:ATP-binding protein [Geitlerinema calcuttense NRMC-F 0142]|uniref:histidine kinase n=2 Tax=Geitlerinema TaxID=63132 RepID=A0ABT7LVG9_9CYAN|nr:ATP-binding protein [Geitlerinema calcuttense]MDL5056038.1 ATP-binding protein [Geitlerinema calcuttense NRMC-F 0142]
MMCVRILVVEDEVIVGMDIKNSLKKLGYKVIGVVPTGEQAIEKAKAESPDLILMDIMLQGSIDGIQAAEEITKHLNLPIVFLTAHTDKNTLQRAKDIYPFGYIVKPFQEKDLYTTLEIALARCKAETEIRKALAKEKELSELKSRFVSMVSHEFRTPMSTILFSSDLLKMYQDQWTIEKKTTHINRIQTSIKRMIEMLDNVLLIGQVESQNMRIENSPLDLKSFCQELIEDIQVADRYQHPILLDLQEACNFVEVDSKILRYILENLLSNAVKYSPENSEVYLGVRCQDCQICLQVKDAGIGIPLSDRQRLFESFYRATNVGTITGTGLGLAIVKRSVELYGGQIEVQSELGEGTSFTVVLPLS